MNDICTVKIHRALVSHLNRNNNVTIEREGRREVGVISLKEVYINNKNAKPRKSFLVRDTEGTTKRNSKIGSLGW